MASVYYASKETTKKDEASPSKMKFDQLKMKFMQPLDHFTKSGLEKQKAINPIPSNIIVNSVPYIVTPTL